MQRYAFPAALAVAALLLLVGAGSPLTDPDEARFARTSVEMLRSQDLVVPRFQGEPRLVKPPLLHWLQVSLFSLLGVSEWVARLPALLATLGSLWLAGNIARLRFGEEAGLWAVAVMTTMPLVFAVGHLGTLDALLALHVLAIVALDLFRPDAPGGYRSVAAGALAGLAFLVKGPVGPILAALLVLAGRTGAGRDVLPSWRAPLLAGAAMTAVVAPWGLAFLRRLGVDRPWSVMREEAFDRYFGGTTHVEPFWFYLPVLVAACLPWIALLGAGLYRAIVGWGRPSNRTARYAATSLLAGLVFFSVSPSKLPTYLLPLMPLAALVITWEIGCVIGARRRHPLGAAMVAMQLVAVAGLFLAAMAHDESELTTTLSSGAVLYGASSVVSARAWWTRRPRDLFAAVAVATALFFGTIGLVGWPALARERSTAELIARVPELHTSRPVITGDMKVPSLAFYLNRPIEDVDQVDLSRRFANGEEAVVVFDEDDLPAVPADVLARLREVGRSGKYVVFETVEPGR